jgi:hypothetical protein
MLRDGSRGNRACTGAVDSMSEYQKSYWWIILRRKIIMRCEFVLLLGGVKMMDFI